MRSRYAVVIPVALVVALSGCRERKRSILWADPEAEAEAVERYSKQITVNPSDPMPYAERALSLLEMDKVDEAIRDFSKALELDPTFSTALHWRANAYEKQGRHREAAEDRLRQVRAFPNGSLVGMGVSPSDWAECAESFVKADEPARGQALLEEYFAKGYPERVTAYTSESTYPARLLSRLYLAQGKTADAVRYGRLAYESPHRVPRDYEDYALALEADNQKELALRVAEEGLKISNWMEGALGVQQRLRK